MGKIIENVTLLTFISDIQKEHGLGVFYKKVDGGDLPIWEDADELLVTINHELEHPYEQRKTEIKINEHGHIIMPNRPITCMVEAIKGKIVMECEI